jgi:hypothetical protein
MSSEAITQAKNLLTQEQCYDNLKKLEAIAEVAQEYAYQIEAHYWNDECSCSLFEHVRKNGIRQEIADACIAARIALNHLDSTIWGNLPPDPSRKFDISVASREKASCE